ncbi:MAG: type II 3-dehydroquinate dehydratase [Rhodocyclales bacterium]|nr:type II 3-dehydroquinate dehydratase [Rhodocyclales bacterium]
MSKPSSTKTKADSRAENSTRRPRILVLHGPNLNLLGRREPEIYGRATLADIHATMEARARARGVQIESFQSNSEGELIDRIQAAATEGIEFIVINPGAYSHTSIAIPDALRGVAIPYIEVHISNIHAREAFRHHSHFSASATGVICGLGIQGYELALDAALTRLNQA